MHRFVSGAHAPKQRFQSPYERTRHFQQFDQMRFWHRGQDDRVIRLLQKSGDAGSQFHIVVQHA